MAHLTMVITWIMFKGTMVVELIMISKYHMSQKTSRSGLQSLPSLLTLSQRSLIISKLLYASFLPFLLTLTEGKF